MTRSDLLHFIPGLSSCTLDQITTWIVQPSLLRKYRLRQRGRWCLEHSPLQLLVKSLSSADRLLWNVTPDTEQRVLSPPSVTRGLVSWLEAKEGLRSCKEVRRTQRNVKTVKLVRLGAGGGVPTVGESHWTLASGGVYTSILKLPVCTLSSSAHRPGQGSRGTFTPIR